MKENKIRILVVDDDLRLRDLLSRYLVEQGFQVKVLPDATGLDKVMEREVFDLMVLDLMMPGEDGLSVCRRLRVAGNALPIIILTAKGDEVDRIVGLEMGADDYLPKPFNPRELLARVNAVLRRAGNRRPAGAPEEDETPISFGNFNLDLSTRELSSDERTVPLTTGEFALLKVLVMHPRQPMSRDKLMELAKGREFEVFDRSIDVQISRLRRLIENDPGKPRYIQTVWGYGYVFIPDGKPQ